MYVHVFLWMLTLTASTFSYQKEASKNIKAEEKIEKLKELHVKRELKFLEEKKEEIKRTRKALAKQETAGRRKLIEALGVNRVIEIFEEK